MDQQTLKRIYEIDKKIGTLENNIVAENKNLMKRIWITALIGSASLTPALVALKTFIESGATVGVFVALTVSACVLPFAIKSGLKINKINKAIKSIEEDKQELYQEKSKTINRFYNQDKQISNKKSSGKFKLNKVSKSSNYYEPEM